MKYLKILNWALFAFGALTAMLFAVVSLSLFIYRNEAERIGSDVSMVMFACGVFCLFSLVSGLAAWALHRRHPLMWLGQGALVLAVVGIAFFARTLSLL